MPFDITISFDYWYKLLALNNPFLIAWQLFKDGGWLVVLFVFFRALLAIWLNWRHAKFHHKQSYTLLAIDIPKDNKQSPKAVEFIFSQLSGIYSHGNFLDHYWEGKAQDTFSVELVSEGGYLQFYIYLNSKYRDLVEAAVYAQYPNAIISEAEDYTSAMKLKFPHAEYDLWGTEMKFEKDNAYPIKTYPHFEHALSIELKDPMAAILEILSRLQQGEKIWLQLVITPIGSHWVEKAQKSVDKFTGAESHGGHGHSMVDWLGDLPLKIIKLLNEAIFPAGESHAEEKAGSKLQGLTPGEIEVLKAIQVKMSKIAFETVFRFIYLGEKIVFNKDRGVKGVMSALQQFNTLDLNALKSNGKKSTSVDYFFVKSREAIRKNALLSKYIHRSSDGSKIILNTEELASIYHFPVMEVKPISLSTVSAKRFGPPDSLPANFNLPVGVDLEKVIAQDDNKPEDEKTALEIALEKVAENKEHAPQHREGIPGELFEK